MITGAIKNKVDKIWTDIWAGGITNPITVIEQLTYLMFIRSLDEKELEREEFENLTGEHMDKIFPQSPAGQAMRWSKFKNRDPRDMFDIISQRVFPAIKNMRSGKLPDFQEDGAMVEVDAQSGGEGQEDTAFARYMDSAMFLIPTPQVLQKIITGLDELYGNDITERDMQGTCTSICPVRSTPPGPTANFALPNTTEARGGNCCSQPTTIPSATQSVVLLASWSWWPITSESTMRTP